MKYKLNSAKMFIDSAEGMTIVIDFTSGGYYGFSSLGSLVVDKLSHGVDSEDIFSSISSLPACPDSFRNNLEKFTGELLEKEILVNDPEAAVSEPFEVDSSALADGFELNCIENTELQDLIVADPVHDVDPNAGWPFMQ